MNPQLPMTPPEDIEIIFGLNSRQARFVYAYLGPAGYCASRAAVMAGYGPKHPRQSGHQAMHSKGVTEAIETLFEQYQARELAVLMRLSAKKLRG